MTLVGKELKVKSVQAVIRALSSYQIDISFYLVDISVNHWDISDN